MAERGSATSRISSGKKAISVPKVLTKRKATWDYPKWLKNKEL